MVPDADRRRPEAACKTGSPAPRGAIRTSRGSCPPTTDARQLRPAARPDPPDRDAARQRGLGRNDRVALLANNSIEHLLCYFGVMAYGATICTVHVEMNRNQLDKSLRGFKPKLVLYQDGLAARRSPCHGSAPRLRLGHWDAPQGGHVLRARPRASAPSDAQAGAGPDDDAVILFTSGTSARPKGVVLNYPRAPAPTSIRPPTASASRRTTASTISARSTGPQRSFSARWCRSTAAPRW